MKSETKLSRKIVQKIKELCPKSDTQRHEDRSEGIPDLSYTINGVSGWVELKQVKEWPSRQSTQVKINHYTKFQRVWLFKRSRAGAKCYVLLMTPEEHYWLFDFPNLMEVGNVTKDKLEELACVTSRDLGDIVRGLS